MQEIISLMMNARWWAFIIIVNLPLVMGLLACSIITIGQKLGLISFEEED